MKSIDESFSNAKPGTGWGMTETNAIGTSLAVTTTSKTASSGRCSALLELKVISENGDEVPTGERGELLIRGTTILRNIGIGQMQTRKLCRRRWTNRRRRLSR